LASAGIFESFSNSAAASITLSSWVPAWVTQICLPSGVQATPQGLAAPRSMSSSSTVLTSFLATTSMIVSALVFIHPRSSCVVGIW
jgi:hypothetical protein